MGYNLDKIRSLNSLSVWLEKYGIAIDKKGFARCPFHQEKTASFKVYRDDTYHCFGCGAHGDVITFVMSIQNITFPEACKLLDGDITYSEQRRIERIKRSRNNQSKQASRIICEFWNAFDEWKENEDRIKLFKPKSPDDIPNALFLRFLNRRSKLEYNLDIAEAAYTKRGETVG